MLEIFNRLGMDYYNRRDYGKILGIIDKDRKDFCKYVHENEDTYIIEFNYESYKILYKKCLEKWYLDHRILLYDLGEEGWGTPLDYDIYKKIEEGFAVNDAQKLINKARQLELTNIQLPYKETIDLLENKIKEFKEQQLLEEGKQEEFEDDPENNDSGKRLF